MCYHYSPAKLKRLQALYPDKFGHLEMPINANGFTHPELPVITGEDATVMKWGLIPHWIKDEESSKKLAKMCLNARIETAADKPAFRDTVSKGQRCLIPASAFFEWRWEDEKGKEKTKFQIEHADTDLFYFGGLYSTWSNTESGEIIPTYTILTCKANEVMEQIHNTKKRMPTILRTDEEAELWLDGRLSLEDLIHVSQEQELEGVPLEK